MCMQKRFHLIVVSLERIVSYFATMGSTIQPGSIFVCNPQRRQSVRASLLSALKSYQLSRRAQGTDFPLWKPCHAI